MNPAFVLINLVLMGLAGGLLSACIVYRRRVVKLRTQLRAAKDRTDQLRAELGSAMNEADRIVNDDPLERMWRVPAVVPAHERRRGR